MALACSLARRTPICLFVSASTHARSDLASNPAQTDAPRSATRSLSWRVSPARLKLVEPVRKRRAPNVAAELRLARRCPHPNGAEANMRVAGLTPSGPS